MLYLVTPSSFALSAGEDHDLEVIISFCFSISFFNFTSFQLLFAISPAFKEFLTKEIYITAVDQVCNFIYFLQWWSGFLVYIVDDDGPIGARRVSCGESECCNIESRIDAKFNDIERYYKTKRTIFRFHTYNWD